jgi:transcriptional regulator with XRE-family HTH domain
MKIPIDSLGSLGILVRATRRTYGLRLDDVAASANLGAVFVGDLEHGKESVQMGRVLQLLAELGITLVADVPQAVLPEFERLQKTGIKPRKARSPAKKAATAQRAGND